HCGERQWIVSRRRARHRPRNLGGRSAETVPGIPAGRQFHHQEEGRHRPGACDLQAHYRDAWRQNRSRVGRGAWRDLLLHAPDRGKAASEARMSKCMLVVEDQEDNRQIVRDLLTTTDYQVMEAENGEEALAAVAKQRPDLILMDIQLPIMDGYEATRRIKADPALSNIPVIAVTSYALSGDEEKARAAGCDDFVPKPFSPRQLLAKIRQYLP